MVSRTFNLQDIGYLVENEERGLWSMSTKAQNCIIKHMRMRYGLTDGDVNVQKGHGMTLYTFTFENQRGKPRQVYTISRTKEGGDTKGLIEIDPTHLEESMLPGEGADPISVGEKRLDKFYQAIQACKQVRLGALPAPAAAGAPRPGFLEPAPAAPAPDYGNLEEMMRRMGVREGGRKKTRKPRRKSKKTLRRR